MSGPTLAEWLLEQIAEDERAAREVPPLDYNLDMGGRRQDECYVFDRRLPSSVDGMGNVSRHRGAETADHFLRWTPARVLAECEAKRRIVELSWHHLGEDDYGWGMEEAKRQIIAILALPYADRPGYRDEWKP